MSKLKINITFEFFTFKQPFVSAVIRECVEAVLAAESVKVPCEINVLVTGDSGIRAINQASRGIDKATDVLSFPMFQLEPGTPPEGDSYLDPETGLCPLGDMAISLERAVAQAKEFGHSTKREVGYLTTWMRVRRRHRCVPERKPSPQRSRVCAVIELVQAGPEWAELLAVTRKLVWLETYRGIYPDDMLDHYDVSLYADRDRKRMSDPAQRYYFFMDGSTCAGYFSFGPGHYGTYKDFALCLNNLYIRREYQGLGLGRRTFHVIRNYCREQGIPKFYCGCNVHNTPAVNFYRHMGGIQGDETVFHDCKAEDIIHFEFYTGE